MQNGKTWQKKSLLRLNMYELTLLSAVSVSRLPPTATCFRWISLWNQKFTSETVQFVVCNHTKTFWPKAVKKKKKKGLHDGIQT